MTTSENRVDEQTAEQQEPAPHEVAARVEELLGEVQQSAPTGVAERVEDLVRSLLGLYGAGLERLVELTGDPRLQQQWGEDPLVGALLALHDLHPVDVETRVQQALDQVRGYLGSHAGGVELLGIDEEGVAQLRLQGSCDGCPSSAATVQGAIEDAVLGSVPEVASIAVEGMVEPEQPAPQDGLLHIPPFRPHQEAPGPCPVPEAR